MVSSIVSSSLISECAIFVNAASSFFHHCHSSYSLSPYITTIMKGYLSNTGIKFLAVVEDIMGCSSASAIDNNDEDDLFHYPSLPPWIDERNGTMDAETRKMKKVFVSVLYHILCMAVKLQALHFPHFLTFVQFSHIVILVSAA